MARIVVDIWFAKVQNNVSVLTQISVTYPNRILTFQFVNIV
jgi:hypothetical protein